MTTINYTLADPQTEVVQAHTLFVCGECGATVADSSMKLHTDWHRRQEEPPSGIPNALPARTEDPEAIINTAIRDWRYLSMGIEPPAKRVISRLREGGWVVAGLTSKGQLDEVWATGEEMGP